VERVLRGLAVARGDRGGETLSILPIVLDEAPVGALVLEGPFPATADLGEAWARQTALALARVRHAAAAEEATVRARTEELRSTLLSTVSHDLRTPLAAITGAATALLDADAPVPPEARRELLVSIRDEAARLERLVGNLLEMTRLTSGPLPVRREWVPLDEVVGAAFARVEGMLAGHPVSVDVPAGLPLVDIDPVLFERVFVNLLENAARHTPPGTPIRLVAFREPDGLGFRVEDDGPGFPPGDGARLFEPFVRGAPARAPGSGLGLAICRGIVEAHGGTIRLARGERGAAVFVHLPTGRAPPVVPEEEA
jgi:two-component system, OmpR family, sensor histidine kinase KdpD